MIVRAAVLNLSFFSSVGKVVRREKFNPLKLSGYPAHHQVLDSKSRILPKECKCFL
jgi:hypothetical protein